MPLPTPLILLGIGALLLFATTSDDKKEEKDKEKLPPGGVEDFPFGHCLDDEMPPGMRNQVSEILTTVVNPDELDKAAEAAANGGFPKAAACLKQKAENIRKKNASGGPWVPPSINKLEMGNMPFTLRYGDFPYGLAQYYTGQGSRFRELENVNSNLGGWVQMPLKDQPGKTYGAYANWAPGLLIKIPQDWSPWNKAYPKPGSQTASNKYPAKAAKENYINGKKAFLAGDYEASLSYFQKAEQLVPHYGPKYYIALCYDKLLMPGEATAAYQVFLSSNPPSPKYDDWVDAAKRRISELGG